MEKQNSKVIYRVAILLLVTHHLFGFLDRIVGTVVPDFYTSMGKYELDYMPLLVV